MDEYDDALDQDTEQSEEAKPEPAQNPNWEAEVRKLRKENQGLRRRGRRSELEAKYGAEIVELIPEELPMTKWDGYAEKLATRLVKDSSQTDQETEPVAEEPPSPEEQRLSAVARGIGPGNTAASSAKVYDRAEWDQLFANPSTRQEALRAAQEGRVRLNNKAAYDGEVKDKEELFTIPR